MSYKLLIALIKLDVKRYRYKTNSITIIKLYFSHLGAKAVILYRISDFFYRNNKVTIAKIISNHNLKCTGAEFCLGCTIESGLLIHHPNGIVIGCGTKIGKNSTILQQVTCGENYKNNNNYYPSFGDNIVIGAGAKILGGVNIGDNCVIGANTVVLKSFDKNKILVGIPAREIIK